jgi:hypothetical protein
VRVRGGIFEGVALIAIAFLPLMADALRGETVRCSQDGARVERSSQVVVDLGRSRQHRFCGVTCADRWMARSGLSARSILVTDCVSGGLVDAGSAHFVETLSAWRQEAGDPVRAFASLEDAMAHLQAYGGELLVGPRRPLQHTPFGQSTKALHDR